ncbi:MAG: ABC transporter permease [Acidobacteria bacterium]|nr:ABC transporter permease [Acidobacteriota bacterium]
MHRTLILIWKEFIEFRQNVRLLPIIFVAPIIQLFFLGYAATTDVKNVPVVVADPDRSPASRELISRFEGSPYFTVVGAVTTVGEVEPFLERGVASMALVIPPDYGTSIGAGTPATVQVIADGSDANSTTVALGYTANLVAGYAQDLVTARSPIARAGGIEPRLRVWFNPQLESKQFMIPGVLALLLMLVTAILSSMAIVREKEVGTLEQLNVTPIRRWELIAGKLLPYAVVGLVDALFVIAVAILWFQIPLRGSFLLLLGVTLVYLVGTLGLGLFVSTISATQQQAMMTATFFFLVPMVYLSGFVFPIENMPAVIQPVTYLIPLRYYLVIVRGIFLKGVGLETFWQDAVALVIWDAAVLLLAIARLRKTTS